MSEMSFPPFSLTRLMKTVFAPSGGERYAIMIDLANPNDVKDFAFLADESLSIQRHAVENFYRPLQGDEGREIGAGSVDFFAFEITGGSNLDMTDLGVTSDGREISLEAEVYSKYDIILCISTYSATAPLTAHAKRHGFRGATLHGVNEIILSSGLAVDYEDVSDQAEKIRLGMTRADTVEIDFVVADRKMTLELLLSGQEAQKSHGLCRGPEPDVANLPAGEVYFVPTGAEGCFPMKYEDGSIGLMTVTGGRIVSLEFLSGSQATVAEHRAVIESDPVVGEIGELGFGTQVLPVSGRDIQDEKVLGTVHVATGRSDHLGGHLTPDLFKEAQNATHDDILFAPHKTPEVSVPQVRLHRGGETKILIENFKPIYMQELVDG